MHIFLWQACKQLFCDLRDELDSIPLQNLSDSRLTVLGEEAHLTLLGRVEGVRDSSVRG